MNRFVRMIAVVGIAALASLPAPARATTLAPLTHDQMVDGSDLIVEGTVLRTWVDQDEIGHVWTHVELKVEASLKGEAAVGDVVTLEAPGGILPDGRISEVALAPRYAVGERTLVYLCETHFGATYDTVGMMMGKFTIRQNPADGSDMVVRMTVPYTAKWDPRFLPHPALKDRVSLRSMEQAIAARVAQGWDGQPVPGASLEHLRAINKLQPGVK
jgi:hypothetical protein